MNFLFPASTATNDRIQSRLLTWAAVFLFLYSLALTLSPAVRLHTWAVSYRWNHWIGFVVWVAGFAFIHRQVSRRLSDHDPYLLPVSALLVGWGMLTIWRLDAVFGLRQTIWLAVGLLAFYVALRIQRPLALLRRYKYIWLTGGLLLTALTFLLGTYPGGAGPHLWLGCCGVYLQPSEPLKLLLIVYLAAYLADNLLVNFSLRQLLPPTLVLVGASLAILVAQRDLGTASLFLLLYFLIIYLASGRWKILLAAAGILLVAAVLGYALFGVIQVRVNAWLNPWLDPTGNSYQIVQSLIAVASGGIIGSGPGLGSPGVVPIAHSDFIFSSIAEENGLLGTLGLIALLALLAGRGFMAALRSSNHYQRYLAAGLSVYFAVQSILIISGNLRLLPLTGVTLPFVSYGGSSLLTSFLALAILSLVANHAEEEPIPLVGPTPYMLTSGLLLAALAAVGLLNGWWAYARAGNLVDRGDNPRWSIGDRYAPRGKILDNENRPIVISTGTPGNYTRVVEDPALGPVVGYTHPIYGQTGLEASLNSYLRGIRGSPSSLIWSSKLLYSQRPPGLNVRLSLDLELQQQADQLLGDHAGAIVLLNARTGEVLVMASHPYFNPNQIDQKWDEWIKDPNAPLINRATQGQYPLGTATGPFLLAYQNTSGKLPPVPSGTTYRYEGNSWNCTVQPANPAGSWGNLVSAGCPGSLVELAKSLNSVQMANLYQALGFGEQPDIQLPVASAAKIEEVANTELSAVGQTDLRVSPLQVALAAAAVSTGGNRPFPLLAAAVDTPQQGWVVLPNKASVKSLPAAGSQDAAEQLAIQGYPLWGSLGSAFTPEGKITWYLGGTRSNWQGSPLAVAVVLEEDNPDLSKDDWAEPAGKDDQSVRKRAESRAKRAAAA